MDYKLEIVVKDVAKGDIDALVDDIETAHADNFDAAHGEFVITVYQREHESRPWFYTDEAES